MSRKSPGKYSIIHKRLGETPLQALERFRVEQGIGKDVPMTYAGRLDPLAEGELLILIGDECKHKESYLGLDKEYEIEVLFGIETDTYDILGTRRVDLRTQVYPACTAEYVGKFTQEYPPYSSKTVGGRYLHELARAGELPDEMPTKEVEIYSIESLGTYSIELKELKRRVSTAVSSVTGDFRQKEILDAWDDYFNAQHARNGDGSVFSVLKLRVVCSSGTYMRSLAHRIGRDVGMGAIALSIKRTRIFLDKAGAM